MKTNHYGVVVDSEAPVTGVFQNNHVYYLGDEFSDAIDLSYEGGLDEFVSQKVSEVVKFLDDMTGDNRESFVGEIRDLCDELEHPEDHLDGLDSTDFLIGFKKIYNKKEAWYWFDQLAYGFMPDEETDYSAIAGEIYTQVVRSNWLIQCNLCSPCYPGQGDADSVGEFLTYSLPPDLFEENDPTRSRISHR